MCLKRLFNSILILLCVMSIWSCVESKKDQKSAPIGKPSPPEFKLKPSPIKSEIIEASVPFISPTFRANDGVHLSYELKITNNYRAPIRIKEIQLFTPLSDSIPLTTFDANYLNAHFTRKGFTGEDLLSIKGNQFGTANLYLSLHDSGRNFEQLYHRIIVELSSRNGEIVEIPMDVALIDYPQMTSIELAFPFKKGTWLYLANSHRDASMITAGVTSHAQRYALDWALMEEDGTFVTGNPQNNESYPTYGLEVLAVEDGTIVATKDSIPNNIPETGELKVRITRETVTGNYVVLELENGLQAVYAHLVPHQLQVKVGDKVTKGQVIGLLGNSGNSTGPHLHFHLETKSSRTLGGQGVPYHFKEFTQLSHYTDHQVDSIFDGSHTQVILDPKLALKKREELPFGNGIIRTNH